MTTVDLMHTTRLGLAVLAALGLTACTDSTAGNTTPQEPTSFPATTLPLPTVSNVGNSATTPIPVAAITLPEGLLGIDAEGDVLEHAGGTWNNVYDGIAYDTADENAQSWVVTAVRDRGTVYASLCCEPVVGITIDTTTGETPYYGELRAADGQGRVAVIDWTYGIRIHDTTTETVREIPLGELSGAYESPLGTLYDLDVRFDAEGGLYLMWKTDTNAGISHIAADSTATSISELPLLWQPAGNAAFTVATGRHEATSDDLWVAYLDTPTLTRVKRETVATMPVIIPLPTGWPTTGTVIVGGTAIAAGADGIHLYRIIDRAGAVIDGPELVWIG